MNDTPEFRGHRWVSDDGLTLYSRVYDRAGSAARTVLCLHGLTRNSKDFEDLAEYLSPRYRVICPDLRGRGLSDYDTRWQNYKPAIYLADIAGLLKSLDIPRVSVIGTSLGGILGMLLPALLPGAITGLVLNDIGPEVDPVGIARIRSYAGKLPPVAGWDEAVAQLRLVFTGAWPGLSGETWQRLARRNYRGNSGARVRPAGWRSAACRSRGRPMVGVDAARRCTGAGDSRRTLRSVERVHLGAHAAREVKPGHTHRRGARARPVA
jgi:pimeloyl-ACP methyl ester carboxylesterase